MLDSHCFHCFTRLNIQMRNPTSAQAAIAITISFVFEVISAPPKPTLIASGPTRRKTKSKNPEYSVVQKWWLECRFPRVLARSQTSHVGRLGARSANFNLDSIPVIKKLARAIRSKVPNQSDSTRLLNPGIRIAKREKPKTEFFS